MPARSSFVCIETTSSVMPARRSSLTSPRQRITLRPASSAALVRRFIGSGKAVDWYYWVYRFIIMGPVKPLTDILTATPTGSFVIGDKTYITTGAETSLLEVPVWTVAVMGVCILLFVLMGYLMYRICYNEDSMLAKLLYKSTRKEETGRRLGGR